MLAMSSAEPWTIGRLLTWTTDHLKKSKADSPRLDAEVLLAHARGCKRLDLYLAFEEVASDELKAKFRELVKQRAEGMPVAYLVGEREFYSLPFYVTRDTLVPRPETEFVVVALLDRARPKGIAAEMPTEDGAAEGATPPAAPTKAAEPPAPIAIADIGTGSGILAICAARQLPQATITAVDISAGALAVAKKNAERHGVAERIELVESDLFAKVPAERRFDYIVSNPPYISEPEFAALSRDVRDFEPRTALVGGPRGTEIIARLIREAGERLNPGGWLLMEISPMIEKAVRELIAADGRFREPATIKDLAQRPRVIGVQRIAAH